MRLNKDNILSNFSNYDERVVDNLALIIDELKNKKVPVNNYSLVIFQLLATQFAIYYKSLDVINGDGDISSEDSYKRKAKSPELAALQKSHQEIVHLLDSLAISPLSSAKVNKLNEREIISKEESSLNKLNKLKGKV